MLSSPERLEIDHHTIKLIIGMIAISLATLTSYFSENEIQSISASYHAGGWSRDIFVGFLFAIAALLAAYNGRSRREMILSKLAALAVMGVAMFPCECEGYPEIIPKVHGISAAIMFLILAIFCYTFFQRARTKKHWQARMRSWVYAFCGATIVLTILVLEVDNLVGGLISSRIDRLTFHGERAGLVAFGIAWLFASQVLPVVSSKEERLSPFA